MIENTTAENLISTEGSTRLVLNGIFGYLGAFASSLGGFIVVPFLLRNLGVEGYGTIVLVGAWSGVFAFVESGLDLAVAREIALDRSDAVLISSAGTTYLLFAAFALVLTFVGVIVSEMGRYAATPRAIIIILLLCVAYSAERTMGFAWAAFAGIDRFDLANYSIAILGIGRSVATLVALYFGAKLMAIAAIYATCSSSVAIVSCMAVPRVMKVRLKLGALCWPKVRKFVVLGGGVSLGGLLQWVVTGGRLALVGMYSGAAGLATIAVGQKLPFAVLDLNWRAAETMVPAAAEQHRDGDSAHELLQTGMRYLAMLVLPIAALIFLLAPNFVRLWIGPAMPGAVPVLRITAIAVFVDALGLPAIHMLWAQARNAAVCWIFAASALVAIVVTVATLPPLGVTGAALAFLCANCVTTIAAIHTLTRQDGASVPKLLVDAVSGTVFPLSALLICSGSAIMIAPNMAGWWVTAGCCGVGALVYLLVLYYFGMAEQERSSLQMILRKFPLFLGRARS